MKKIWLMLLVICSVCAFSACSDDDEKKEEEKVCPVTNIVVPETAEVGETITITGEGFDTTAKFKLQNEAEEKVDMETAFVSDKEVSCVIPVVEAGEYKVILSQDSEDWDIEKTIEISVPERKLRVKKITATTYNENVFNFTYDEENRVSNITQIPNGQEAYASSYDFTYEENRIVVSANYADSDEPTKKTFIFEMSNGKVINTIDEEGDSSEWVYNDNNYLVSGGYQECKFTWNEENNLTQFAENYDTYMTGNAVFGNPELKNNIIPVDILPIMYNTYGYILGGAYDYDILAYMLGICGNRSANLPTEMTDDSGNMQTIHYTMDTEHPEYVLEASIETEWDPYSIKIVYE